MDNLRGRWQWPRLSRTPTPRRSGNVREAPTQSQPEESQDTYDGNRSRVERLVSTVVQYGQGAVTPCCIVLTFIQFQTKTDALRTMFIVHQVLRFQGFQRQRRRGKRSVSSEIRQKQMPVTPGRLCPFEHHLKKRSNVMTIKTRNPGIYQTLIVQLDKTAWHNRKGSFRTKERYYEAMQRFCKFLSSGCHPFFP